MTTPHTRGAADLPEMVSKALREAYNLGQRYWQQADSEYISQHKKADDTRAKFLALVEETCAALAAGQATAAKAVVPSGWNIVPTEPTQAMLDAVVTSMDDFLLGKEAEKQYREDWAAMLAAAPAQPAAQQGAAYAALPEPDLFADCDSEGGFLGDTSDVRVLNTALFRERSMRAFADATHMLRASHGQAPAGAGMGHTDGGRNMFYEGRFDGESQREQQARLRWANDMRAAFERHTGNGWFDKDWRTETGLWSSAWHACLAAQPTTTAQADSVQ